MKMLNTKRLLIALLTVAATGVALADEFRIGYVNTERIFREANSAIAAQAKLQQEFSKREKDLVELGNSLKTASEKFERDAPTMSESQRVTRQRQIGDQDREFQRKRREFQEDLNARKNEEFQLVLERATCTARSVLARSPAEH